MGILDKMRAVDISRDLLPIAPNGPGDKPQAPAAAEKPRIGNSPPAGTPTAPCSACSGLHWWIDAYGNWNCLNCRPPIAMAQVRKEMVVYLDPSEAPNEIPIDTGTMRIIAVGEPDGRIIWADESTQAERRGAAETLEWFERTDRRLETQAAKIAAKSQPQ